MEVGQIRQRRLSDNIVEQLETMILEGTLQPGQRLPAERALAEQFGVSRPSLREAVQKLVAKGLLISRQGGGNYVSDSLGSSFSDPLLSLLEGHPEAHRDLLEFRHTLEADCAYYAALRATPARARRHAPRKAPPTRAFTWQLPKPATTWCCCTPFAACSTCSNAMW